MGTEMNMTREEALAEALQKVMEHVYCQNDYTKRDYDEYYAAIRKAKAALALPADAPPAEPSDRELREWLWKNHGHVALYGDDGEMQCPECNPWDYKRAPLLAVVRAAFAAVRVSTPTLTESDVRSVMRRIRAEDLWDGKIDQILADAFNAILAAKSQKGGDAKWLPNSEKESETIGRMSTDRARTEPVKTNECDTPSAAWGDP